MSKTYSDHESDCSSYSYNPEFKSYVDEIENRLIFIRCNPYEKDKQSKFVNNNESMFRNEYKRMSMRKNRGILSKFTGRKKKSLFEWKILDKNKYERKFTVIIIQQVEI